MWFAVTAAVVIGFLLYKLFFSNSESFWRKHGIREIDTTVAVGTFDILLSKKSMADADLYAYTQMSSTDKVCGIMEMSTPLLVVKDMELVKKVLIKDFEYFADRRKQFTEHDGGVKKMLLNLEGDEWKGVRAAVSPTFTTGKIRRMMEFFNEVGKEWVEEFTRKANSNERGSINIDVLSSINQYTVSLISTSVFGMNAGIIKNPDSVFGKMANQLTNFSSITKIFKFVFRLNFPRLSHFLKVSVLDKESMTFFESILKQNLKSRMTGETRGNDFLQLMVEAKKGELKAVGSDELSSFEKDAQIVSAVANKRQYLTEEIINAQSIIFFFAGFSTTSDFITFALYHLALYRDIQEKLRQEIDQIIKTDGTLDYDDVGKLVYMDMVTCEVFRKFPAVGRLERVCVKDYRDAESGLFIPKGTLVGIPIIGIHNDRLYYDNPDKFDPNHFAPDKKTSRNPYAFMPFGVGPRSCIGMRFAQVGVKAGLAYIVHNFIIEPTSKTPVPLQSTPSGLRQVPPKGLELKLTPIRRKK